MRRIPVQAPKRNAQSGVDPKFMRHPVMKKHGISILLVLLGIGMGLLIGEIAVRFIFPTAAESVRLYDYMERTTGKFTRFDPVIGWAGIPNVSDTHTWPDSKCRIRQNRHGFRGTEHPFARTDWRRIVMLGDSFLWGFGVDEPYLFTRIVEATTTPPVEIVNLGVTGYGNDQMYLTWRQIGHKWDPDEVWLFITFVTDLTENVRTEAYEYSKPVFRENSDGRLEFIPMPPDTRHDAGYDNKISVTPRNRHPVAYIIAYSDLGLPGDEIAHEECFRTAVPGTAGYHTETTPQL